MPTVTVWAVSMLTALLLAASVGAAGDRVSTPRDPARRSVDAITLRALVAGSASPPGLVTITPTPIGLDTAGPGPARSGQEHRRGA